MLQILSRGKLNVLATIILNIYINSSLDNNCNNIKFYIIKEFIIFDSLFICHNKKKGKYMP